MITRMVSNKVILAFAFICSFAALTTSQSAVSVRVVSIGGSVQISRSNGNTVERINVQSGEGLLSGDVIKTGFDGRVILELDGTSRAIISPNSTVELGNAASSPRTIFNQIRGKTRIKIEKLGGKPNPYQVTTPTTVIAVRGTIFDVFVKDDETSVFVIEGEVSVALITFPDREVLLGPGEFTRVKENQPPEPPAAFRPNRNDAIFNPVPGDGQGRSPFENPGVNAPGTQNGSGSQNTPAGNRNIPAPPARGGGRGRP